MPSPDNGYPQLLLRILSALVLASITLATIFVPTPWFFAGWVGLLGALVLHEWYRVTRTRGTWFAIAALAGCWYAMMVPVSLPAALYISVVGSAGTGLFALLRRTNGLWAALGCLYVTLPIIAILWCWSAPVGAPLLFWLFLVVWTTDTSAFVVGRIFGGPKLAVNISPDKTWSGAIGGLIGGCAVGTLFASFVGLSLDTATVFAAVISISAQAGDLFQSRVKRVFAVKDSGSILPGHGGVMDRLDSLLFAAPVFALFWVFYLFLPVSN